MDFFRKLFALIVHPKSLVTKATSKNGERLTDYESRFTHQNKCPDCRGAGFYEGPDGGGSINVVCANEDCSSRFNIMGPFGVKRISNPSPNRLVATEKNDGEK